MSLRQHLPLGEGHVDEVVGTTADGEAEVTGPLVGNPGVTSGEVFLKEKANVIYKTEILSSHAMFTCSTCFAIILGNCLQWDESSGGMPNH